jgi:hypothetical protein
MKITTRNHFFAGLLILAGLISMTASAAPNPLLGVQTGNPDILYRSGTNQGCSYDGTTLTITATPLTMTLISGATPDFITGGTLTITADIDSSGTFSTGSITVTGVAGAFSSPLVTGTVTNYGIADLGLTADRSEFTFTVTGGSLATDYGGAGIEGGVITTMENSTYAGSFASNWACDVAKGNIGPTPPPPIGDGTGTIGYWKTHPDAWPTDSITIGGTVYTKSQAIDILGAAVKGDKTLSMAKQLIAAKLNVIAGNDSSCIADTIAAADTWLSNHGGVGSGQRQWDDGDLLHDELDAYNNGLLCAPHRG